MKARPRPRGTPRTIYDPCSQRGRQCRMTFSNPLSEALYDLCDPLESPRQWYLKCLMEGAQTVEGIPDDLRAELTIWCQRQIRDDRKAYAKHLSSMGEEAFFDDDEEEEALKELEAAFAPPAQSHRLVKTRKRTKK